MARQQVVVFAANAHLYGFCHGCSHPRALRKIVDLRLMRATYEIWCPACGDTERLSA
jgi:hypothetical protein